MTPISEVSFQNHFDEWTDSSLPGQDNPRFYSLMTTALGKKDYYTHLHAQRVAAYAGRIAVRMGLPTQLSKQVALGGMLHDMGKLALSDQLFSSDQTEMTEDMWVQVHSHPLIGAALVVNTYGKGPIYDAVLYHHERLNGSGYPFGLQGNQIPQSAQIVSVADSFDAITTDRPYQKRKSIAEAFRILRHTAGKFLNAELVELLIEDIQKAGMIPLSSSSRRARALRSAAV